MHSGFSVVFSVKTSVTAESIDAIILKYILRCNFTRVLQIITKRHRVIEYQVTDRTDLPFTYRRV